MKEAILSMLKERKTYAVIAEELGVSRSTIAGIVYRNRPRRKYTPLVPSKLPSSNAVQAMVDNHRFKRDHRSVKGIGRVLFCDAVQSNGCLWIDGDVMGKTMCCGSKRQLGRPYCEDHYKASISTSKAVDIERLADRF